LPKGVEEIIHIGGVVVGHYLASYSGPIPPAAPPPHGAEGLTTLWCRDSLESSRHLRSPHLRRWKMAPPSPAFPKLDRVFNDGEIIIIVERLGEALE
jgi:hypothetical protein